MRKLLLPLLVVASLAAVGAAAGSTSTTVTISKTGYTPTAVTISTGDAVIFKNTDTVAHTVVLTPTTGVNCGGAVPLAIPAGQSATCTFSSAGKFKFSDPASKKKAFRGTITVTPPLVSSVTATPKNVLYGHTSTIAGKVASGQSGQSVQISAQGCTGTSTVVATVTTTAGGAFSYQAQPVDNTSYTLSSQGLTSSISIGVKPRLHLAKIGGSPLQAAGLCCPELPGHARDLPALPLGPQALGGGQACQVPHGRDQAQPDRDHVGEVPLGHQGAPARACQSRPEAGPSLLPARPQQHDSQLKRRRGGEPGRPGSPPPMVPRWYGGSSLGPP